MNDKNEDVNDKYCAYIKDKVNNLPIEATKYTKKTKNSQRI